MVNLIDTRVRDLVSPSPYKTPYLNIDNLNLHIQISVSN